MYFEGQHVDCVPVMGLPSGNIFLAAGTSLVNLLQALSTFSGSL